jgi:hypothetical protein
MEDQTRIQIKNLLESSIQEDITKRSQIRRELNKNRQELMLLNSEILRKTRAKNQFLGVKEPKKNKTKDKGVKNNATTSG